MSGFPEQFTAGDTVEWVESGLPADATAAQFYIRSSGVQGATVTGSLAAGGWSFTLLGGVTAAFDPTAQWWGQIVVTVGGYSQACRFIEFKVAPSLAYTGSPAALDLRSEAEKRLEAVEAAIDALATGAQEYRIGFGNQGRTVKRADLAELIQWRDRLKAQVIDEQRNRAGLRDRGVYVRFTD